MDGRSAHLRPQRTISVTTDLVFFFSLGFLSLSLGLFGLTFSYLVGLYQTVCFSYPHTLIQKEEKRHRETRCLSRIDSRHLIPLACFFFPFFFFLFAPHFLPSAFFPSLHFQDSGNPRGRDRQEKTQTPEPPSFSIAQFPLLWAARPISSSRPGNAFKFHRIG